MATLALSADSQRVSRFQYAQSYRRVEIYEDVLSGQYFIGGTPGEQFDSLAHCEDEIDRRLDRESRKAAHAGPREGWR